MRHFALPVGVGLLVLAGGVAGYFALAPVVSALRTEVSAMRSKIAEAEGYAQELLELQRREAELRAAFLQLRQKAFFVPQPDRVLAELQGASVAAGVRLVRLTEVSYEEGEGGFGRQRFQAVLQGRYPELWRFLRGLAGWWLAWSAERLEVSVQGGTLQAVLDFLVPVFSLSIEGGVEVLP